MEAVVRPLVQAEVHRLVAEVGGQLSVLGLPLQPMTWTKVKK